MRRAYFDPGTRCIGGALFINGHLNSVKISRTPSKVRSLDDMIAHHVKQFSSGIWGNPQAGTVEIMQWQQRSTAQDLIDVQAVGCSVVGLVCRSVRLVVPRDWKGGTPKDIHHKRMLRALTSWELNQMSAAGTYEIVERALNNRSRGNDKEALDAIGIGLYFNGRIDRKGTPT